MRHAASRHRCRPRLRRGHRARRHAARGHAAADVPGGRDAGALSHQPQRAVGDPEQRQRRRGDGRRCRGSGRRAAVHAAARDPARPGCPAGAARRATRRRCSIAGDAPAEAYAQALQVLQQDAAAPALAADPRTQRGGAQRAGRACAAAAGAADTAAADGLLAGPCRRGRGAQRVPAGRHRQLRHAGRGGERLFDAGGLSPQPGAADRGAAQHQPGHRAPTPPWRARWCSARWAAGAPSWNRTKRARCWPPMASPCAPRSRVEPEPYAAASAAEKTGYPVAL